MLDGWMLWLILVGLAIGLVSAWLLLVRLPRDEADVDAEERHDEAAWISGTIERHGGIAPASLVEEVLELHQAYLRDPALAQVVETTADELPPLSPPPARPPVYAPLPGTVPPPQGNVPRPPAPQQPLPPGYLPPPPGNMPPPSAPPQPPPPPGSSATRQ